MQDIESLTNRIISIGKGKTLLDGDLNSLKKKYTSHKTITIEYSNGNLELYGALSLVKSLQQKAILAVNTNIISISEAYLGFQKALKWLISPFPEEMVVSLYNEHQIWKHIYSFFVLVFQIGFNTVWWLMPEWQRNLLGRTSNPFFILLPLVGVLFPITRYAFWRFGLRHYKSTSS